MIVDLINLEDSLFKFDFTLEPGEIDLSDEAARLKTPVAVKGELKKGIVETTDRGGGRLRLHALSRGSRTTT
jgi:hypothetical protein